MKKEDRNARGERVADRRGEIGLDLRERGLALHVALRESLVEVRDLAVGCVEHDVADLPRQRDLLADRQVRVEHDSRAGQCRAVGSAFEIRRQSGSDRDESEHQADVPGPDRQVCGGSVGRGWRRRKRSQHISCESESRAEDGERGGEVCGAGVG